MQNDAISRSAVLAVGNVRKVVEYDEAGYDITYFAVPVEEIEKLLALDVAPVVHAKWEDHHCTNCNQEAALLYECIGDDEGFAWYHSDFCPNCGAKMDGECNEAD